MRAPTHGVELAGQCVPFGVLVLRGSPLPSPQCSVRAPPVLLQTSSLTVFALNVAIRSGLLQPMSALDRELRSDWAHPRRGQGLGSSRQSVLPKEDQLHCPLFGSWGLPPLEV